MATKDEESQAFRLVDAFREGWAVGTSGAPMPGGVVRLDARQSEAFADGHSVGRKARIDALSGACDRYGFESNPVDR